MRVASSSKTAMNSAPIIFLLVSQAPITPASLLKETLARIHGDNLQAKFLAQILLHAHANSFLRSTPLLTKMQVNWASDGPMHQHRRH
jgi:hypothetical protein